MILTPVKREAALVIKCLLIFFIIAFLVHCGSICLAEPVDIQIDSEIAAKQDEISVSISKEYSELDYIKSIKQEMTDKTTSPYNVIRNRFKEFATDKNYEALIHFYEVVAIEFPSYKAVFCTNFRGTLYRDKTELKKLEDMLLDRIAVKPYYCYYEMAASIAGDMKHYEDGIKYQVEVLKRRPAKADDYRQLAGFYRALHEPDSALFYYNKARKLSFDKYSYHYDISSVLDMSESKFMVPEMISDWENNDKKRNLDWRFLAKLYYKAEDYPKALKTFLKSCEETDNDLPNFIKDFLPVLSDIMTHLNISKFPDEAANIISKEKQAIIVLCLSECYIRESRFKTTIVTSQMNGHRVRSKQHHNFPAAVSLIRHFDEAGLPVPDDHRYLYERLKAYTVHYNGDVDTALKYYNLQKNKQLPEKNIFRYGRKRLISEDTGGFADLLSRNNLPAGTGMISGKLRFNDKSIGGINVVAAWSDEYSSRYSLLRLNHPLSKIISSSRIDPPPSVQAVTNDAGEFIFDNMPDGFYSITFFFDAAVISPDNPNSDFVFYSDIPKLQIEEGRHLSLGSLDIGEGLKITAPEENDDLSGDICRITWDWNAMPPIKDYKFKVSVFQMNSLMKMNTRSAVVNEDVGKNRFYDLDPSKLYPDSEVSIQVALTAAADGKFYSTICNDDIKVVYPSHLGNSPQYNKRSKSEFLKVISLERRKMYDQFLLEARMYLKEFPTSIHADDMLLQIAFTLGESGDKEKAKEVYGEFFERFPCSLLMSNSAGLGTKYSYFVEKYAELTGGNKEEVKVKFENSAREARKSFRQIAR